MRAEAQCLSWITTPSGDDDAAADTLPSSQQQPPQVEDSNTGSSVHVFIASMTDQREYFHR